MLWLYLALLAYFINAVAFIIDKHLLASSIPKPFAYAFGVSLLSILSLVLIPFGVLWPGLPYLLVALASGGAFFIALIFLYKSIRLSDVSVASTNVATISAICTYFFSTLILGDQLTINNEFAFGLLVLGIFSLGLVKKEIFKFSLLSGIFMGLSMVLLKWTFNSSDFINGIFWTRIGFLGSAFAVLVSGTARKEIFNSFHNAPSSSLFLFVLNKIIAGTGFIIYYYAISLGSVSLINALLGTQFVFIFILAIVFRQKISGISENLSGKILFEKITGVVLIGLGFLMLFK
jgi:uncharacterized membrane protein